ncbi:TIGR00269 family protein [Candidatus Bathyarchaeota archaeon]|nr:MAG: TIGR00269 family protein [Candidatus Bathyarchaeota archaeon]
MKVAPLCTKCGSKPSVYFRPYSGERLCPGCFAASIRERVERTISRFRMFEFDSRIAVGVSGGKDSLSLLHLLVEIEEQFPKAEVIAVSIDEGVRGYRDEALRLAGEACRSLGVEWRTLSFADLFGLTMDEITGRRGELTPCSYCGVLRRRALNQAARDVEADRLATAHNLDDMAQTALLNLMRGDLRRLAGMHPAGSDLPGFVRRVKPFCEVPERESTLYAYLRGIEFQSRPCPYAETAMRTDIRRFLNRMEVKRPGIKFIIYRAALEIIPRISVGGAEPSGRCRICGEPTRGDVCRVCQLVGELSKEAEGEQPS